MFFYLLKSNIHPNNIFLILNLSNMNKKSIKLLNVSFILYISGIIFSHIFLFSFHNKFSSSIINSLIINQFKKAALSFKLSKFNLETKYSIFFFYIFATLSFVIKILFLLILGFIAAINPRLRLVTLSFPF